MAHERGKFTSRTKARKRAAEVLFEADQKGIITSPGDLLGLLEERKYTTAAPSPLPPYAIRIIEGVAANQAAIDDLLARHAKGGGLDRIPAVDLAVLRVGVWELIANAEEVPPITAIDEAVAVVSQLSTDTSAAYVNAVLDATRKGLEDPWAERSRVVIPEEESDPNAAPAPEETFEDDEFLDEY